MYRIKVFTWSVYIWQNNGIDFLSMKKLPFGKFSRFRVKHGMTALFSFSFFEISCNEKNTYDDKYESKESCAKLVQSDNEQDNT